MLVPFESLPDHARVWIYQSSLTFTPEMRQGIILDLESFLKNWTTHGQNLVASYEMPYDRFIIIGIDGEQQEVTGCSIDSSVRFIQNLEQQYKIDLLDKMNVTHKKGFNLLYTPLKEFRSMAKKREITPDTIVFNNLIETKIEYKTHWEVPVSQSWHSRFVK